MTPSDAGAILRTLGSADVQVVVVGDPASPSGLRLVVSRHPTNLAALATALDRLGAVLAVSVDADGHGPRRVGDPLGAMTVTTDHGPVDLLFGGPGRSLYAETVDISEPRVVGGIDIRWAAAPPAPAAPADRSARSVGRRLRSIADALGEALDGPREEPEGRPTT